MNKKNKNKNRSTKPQNPTPPQESESEIKQVTEEIESVVKAEERVPEIISEVIPKVDIDVKEDDDDSPKKPRRNRGKKKKQDQGKESIAETENHPQNVEENITASIGVEAKDEKNTGTKAENVNIEEIKKSEDMPAMPASRKKKGKNKALADPEEKEVAVAEENNTVQKPDTSKDGKISELPEVETKKKKNKKGKKNRTDSEKSEHTEEIPSCTSAFQKLLLESEKSKPDQIEKSEEQSVVTEPIPIVQIPVVENIGINTQKEIGISVESKEECKGKKKNKKEKKLPVKETDEHVIPAPPPLPAELIFKEIIQEEIIALPGEQDSSTKNISGAILKTETRIVLKEPVAMKNEPVKPKRHGHKEPVNVPEVIPLGPPPQTKTESAKSTEVEKQSKESKEMKTKEEITLKEEPVVDKKECPIESIVKSEGDKITQHEEIPKQKAKIAKPVEKKGKGKSNAPSVQHSEEPVTDNTPVFFGAEIDTAKAPDIHQDVSMTNQKEIKLSSQTQPESIATAVLRQKIKEIDIEIQPIEIESITEIKPCNLETPELIKGKKHKKSPKPERKNKNTGIIEQESAKVEMNITIDLESNLPSLDRLSETDDELLKIEKEKHVPPIVPDTVEYPRSSSENLDGNNNTLIQEITTSQISIEENVIIPDMPSIVGSGETPVESPLSVMTAITVTEFEITPAEKDSGEKTDLKSKVIAVNQDMEELRLSIEKSLAELTALEKIDEQFETKEFAKDDLKCENIKVRGKEKELHKTRKSDVDSKMMPTSFKLEKPASPETSKQMPSKTDVTDMPKLEKIVESIKEETKQHDQSITSESCDLPTPPQRKEHKGKNKQNKKKGKQESCQTQSTPSTETTTQSDNKQSTQETKKEDTSQKEKTIEDKNNENKQKDSQEDNKLSEQTKQQENLDPIENFEDALTSSTDNVNQSFEIIADEVDQVNLTENTKENPEINISEAEDEASKENKKEKENPVSQPKNLLGHPDIPVQSSKTDYKKEKNKTPNARQAKIKIKDSEDIEKAKESKESQTVGKPKFIKEKLLNESVTCVTNENEEYVYKYSFRKVFLSSACQVCKKELKNCRVACNFCNLVFYCSPKHRDEDVPQHQSLCFAVSTITHLKGQKHIYANTEGITGHNYRVLRMQTIMSCEKILKRKLLPWEQEALLYPRMCAEPGCREWRQSSLKDCDGCGQISYCTANPDHFPKSHGRWCKSYSLYQKLVVHQLTRGRLEPKLPTRILAADRISDNINRLFADLYDEKIDMDDIQYASLTQLATAPLTAVYSYQLYRTKMEAVNGLQKKSSLTVHVVGAELQFEADSLNKWETFFLHVSPQVKELNVCLIGPELNPGNLPLELLGKIKMCPTCRVEKRRVLFNFQDKQLYHQYFANDDFRTPDIVCALNPSINRSSPYTKDDTWSATINCILKQRVPFLVTAYTMNELQRDLNAIAKNCSEEFNMVSEPKFNPFASVRPDRNFITDDEIPLLFKNYCFMVLVGAF